LPRPLDLSGIPRPRRRRPWLAIAVSVVLHLLVLAFGWIEGRLPDVPHRPQQVIILAPPAENPEAVEMRWQSGRPAEGRAATDRVGERPTPRVERRPPERTAVVPEPRVLPRTEVDTGTAPRAPRRPPLIGRIGPELAEGRLWVRPLPLPPQELAKRLQKTHVELVDSAVTAIVQGYLDSIATDPASRNVGLPSWTTTVAGKKFGIDANSIHVAGLKIPAAVLALLRIPLNPNIDQNQAYDQLMGLRSDLLQAAQRTQNLDEFKSMIREMRDRKEREREFERNQRTAPEPAPDQAPVP
jgi:hypothetical protein